MTIYTHINASKRRSWFLILVAIAVLALLGYLLDYLNGTGTYFWLPFIALYAIVSALIGYYSGDKIALWTSGAKPIAKEQNPYLYRMVENLTIAGGLPMPKVHVIEDPAINAFATGRDPKHASIAVTTGALTGLQNEELEGVIAHELSHIGNYDIRYMTLVIVIVGTIALLAHSFWRMGALGGRGRGRGRGGEVIVLIGIVFLIIAPLVGELIKLAVSRRREFLADASGALLTRYPEGLARALEKIGQTNVQPMLHANNATSHLYIANPFGAKAVRGMSRLFSTHPPIEERIAALRKMGGQ